MSNLKTILFITLTLTGNALFAKRTAPVDIEPIIYQGIKYTVLHWSKDNGSNQNGGYILATLQKSGKKVWGKQLYKTNYSSDLENDIQDVFISSMSLTHDHQYLLVTNENGQVYKVDLSSQKIIKIQPGT